MNELNKYLIDAVWQGIKKEAQRFGGKAHTDCVIQAGYQDYIKIVIKGQKIKFYFSDLSFSSPDIIISVPVIEGITVELIENEVIPLFRKELTDAFMTDEYGVVFNYFLDYHLFFDLPGIKYNTSGKLVNEEKRLKLVNDMTNFIQEVVIENKRDFKTVREPLKLCGQLLEPDLMNYPPAYVIELFEKCNKNQQNVRTRKFKRDWEGDLVFYTEEWAENIFLPLYYDCIGEDWDKKYVLKKDFDKSQVDPELLSLYIYTALCRIKYGTYSYDPTIGREHLERAKQLGSEAADRYMKKGSGNFADEDIYYKDKDVECEANDIFTRFTIKIKNETADSYRKAMHFVINLLQKGFPGSYFIKLSSKAEKTFLPIKGIAKSQTHRFFATALTYPELYDKIEEYANAAMKEFEWYEDVQAGEQSLMPGSYAVFGLGLTDPKYFPLIEKYMDLVDEEHQLAHKNFTVALIDKYGITTDSVNVIIKCILSNSYDMVYKNLATVLSNPEKLLLFINAIDQSQREELTYAVWGGKEKLQAKIKKAKGDEKELLEKML